MTKTNSLNLILQKDFAHTYNSSDYENFCSRFHFQHAKDEWHGAVLFLFADNHLILIKRSESTRTHRGQLAFFGGHREPHEHDPCNVALREFSEESGHNLSVVTPLGLLPPLQTHQNFTIIPVLGELQISLQEFRRGLLSHEEWTHCIAVPFDYLMNSSHWVYARMLRSRHLEHSVLYCPLRPQLLQELSKQTTIDNKPYMLWGVTAKIIWNFLHILSKITAT